MKNLMKAASRSTIEIWPRMKPCVKESLGPEHASLVVCNWPVRQRQSLNTHVGSEFAGQASCAILSKMVPSDDGFALCYRFQVAK